MNGRDNIAEETAEQLQLGRRLHRAVEHEHSTTGLASIKRRSRFGVPRRYRSLSMGLAASDAVCVVVALVVSYYLLHSSPAPPMPIRELVVVVLAPLLWVAVFHAFDLYRPQLLSAHEEFRRTVGAASVGIMLLVMASFLSNASFSRSWVALTWATALVLELVMRRGWRWQLWRLRQDGRLAFRTLVVGTTAEAGHIWDILRAPASGFMPLGYVQASEGSVPVDSGPVLGEIGDLHSLIQEQAADCLLVVSTAITADDMSRVAEAARREGAELRVSANLPRTLPSRLSLQKVGPELLVALRPVRLTGTQAVLKRAFDLVVASVALLISAPLWAVIAVAIRLDSHGPVLFHQERVTKDGRIFRMHKFRTMRTDVDAALDTTTPFFKLQADPRLTRVGGFLRRFSVDELPELWNVLTGDMSIVGPRPLPADQVAANIELLTPRHEVPAGMTGWWMISGRSSATPEEALRLDLFYIENWSLTLDLYVLIKTFGAIVSRRGAY